MGAQRSLALVIHYEPRQIPPWHFSKGFLEHSMSWNGCGRRGTGGVDPESNRSALVISRRVAAILFE